MTERGDSREVRPRSAAPGRLTVPPGGVRPSRTRRVLAAVVLGGVVAGTYGAWRVWGFYRHIDAQVTKKFSGVRWKLPSRILSAPFAVYPGMELAAIGFVERLGRLGYIETPEPARRAGEYHWIHRNALEVVLRAEPATGAPAQYVRLELADGRVERLAYADTGEEPAVVELAGEPVAGIYDEVWQSRQLVTMAEVPSLLVQAILAVEDRRFFEHAGVDWRAVLRALWVNVRAGGVRQGGSTLTQQLMKNFFLSTERTVQRKAVELVMARVAERRYSKLEILENYLNEIYLGQGGARGIFGIREGALFYFGKEPGDLSLGQVALLAGLIQAPNRYSPYHAPDRALRRRDVVLSRMRRAEMVTEADYREARAELLGVRPDVLSPRVAPYFVDYVRQELAEVYPAEVLTQDGLQIYTSLDTELQRAAEHAVEAGLARLEEHYAGLRSKDGEPALEACLVAMQPQTGEIKAMVGGRRYAASQFNRAVRARRQVGSLFKPVVYAAALAEGRADGSPWLPTSRIEDTEFEWEYDAQIWRPANYDDRYLGLVTLRDALERSLNAATARTAHEVGLPAILATARRLGFDDDLPPVPAIVLGAGEATPIQVARVYAALANGGLRPSPLATRRVSTAEGGVLERRRVRVAPVLPAQVAFMVTHMLRGVLERGTGRLAMLDVPAAGKTGTTDGYRDAWFAGYTPELVAVVWVGFDQGRAVGLPGSQAALPIWADFMKIATAGRPGTPFVPPPGIGLARIDPETGGLATALCPEAIDEAFPADMVPTAPCPAHPVWTAGDEVPVDRRPSGLPEHTERRWLPWPF